MTTNASDLVPTIAQVLGETEKEPIEQISRLIKHCGQEDVQKWLHEAQAIEANGGMLLPDKSRRRTPGGVFFKVARDSMKADGRKALVKKVFHWRFQKDTSILPAPHTPPTPTTPAFTWDQRGELMAAATPGKATTVKITIIGRPGKAVERPQFTLVLLKKSGPLPALPKGIPAPPTNETDYILYIGSKQWAKVKESLKQPEDVLIVEGTPVLDPKYSAITVFATNVTTKLLQAAQRQERQSME